MHSIILSTLALPALLSAALLSGCVPFPSREGEALPAADAKADVKADITGDAAGFPQAMRGRWGLVPADCDRGRADAKGLMVVAADSLTFYESRGTIASVQARTADRIEADIAYSGEGMTWEHHEALRLTEEGRLERVATGEGAIPGTLSYAACPG